MGAMLLNHLSRPNVRRHGVQIQGEAVVQGEHTLYLIVEADDESRLARVHAAVPDGRQPRHLSGVDLRARRRQRRLRGARCPVSESVPALDPEDACQQAIDAGLVVHRAHPLNCETSIPALIGGVVMPNAHFYVRNHFQIPTLDPAAFRLDGWRPRRPAAEPQPARPPPDAVADAGRHARVRRQRPDAGSTRRSTGEKWNLGAVSTAEWTGVPLVEVLDRAGVRAGAREVLFRGADGGTVDGQAGADPLRAQPARSIRRATETCCSPTR